MCHHGYFSLFDGDLAHLIRQFMVKIRKLFFLYSCELIDTLTMLLMDFRKTKHFAQAFGLIVDNESGPIESWMSFETAFVESRQCHQNVGILDYKKKSFLSLWTIYDFRSVFTAPNLKIVFNFWYKKGSSQQQLIELKEKKTCPTFRKHPLRPRFIRSLTISG